MTDRQAQILAAIVEQYAEIAAPVGSVTLAKLFNVSPATIRAEMSRLEDGGYITHPHTSAGRIPTDKGYRYYVNSLGISSEGPEQAIDRSARAIGVRLESAGGPARAIRSAADSLAEITHNLGLATIGGQLYMSGLSHLFMQPEFGQVTAVKEVARLLDNLEPWLREAAPTEPINVYIGQENPIGRNSGCTLIISRFVSPYSDNSYVGTLGPTRQSYRSVMDLVSYTAKSLEAAF
ncbi:MAG TPA: transcriptional regulator [Candidatus Saccharimonadales bacterium]|nr:transcriptional regulator [Candidatus Saccharimonadales bacterium]